MYSLVREKVLSFQSYTIWLLIKSVSLNEVSLIFLCYFLARLIQSKVSDEPYDLILKKPFIEHRQMG